MKSGTIMRVGKLVSNNIASFNYGESSGGLPTNLSWMKSFGKRELKFPRFIGHHLCDYATYHVADFTCT